MTATTLPPRKPEWLRQQLGMLEQREEMIRSTIDTLHGTQADYMTNGNTPPAPLLRAIDQSNADLAEVTEQINVLNTGWDTLHPKP